MTMIPLPSASPIVEGILDIRGSIVPVLDIRRRLQLPDKPAAHTDHLIVADAGERRVALRVDRTIRLARIEPGNLADAVLLGHGTAPVAGVAKLPDGLVLIHDLATFLSEAEALALDEALADEANT